MFSRDAQRSADWCLGVTPALLIESHLNGANSFEKPSELCGRVNACKLLGNRLRCRILGARDFLDQFSQGLPDLGGIGR